MCLTGKIMVPMHVKSGRSRIHDPCMLRPFSNFLALYYHHRCRCEWDGVARVLSQAQGRMSGNWRLPHSVCVCALSKCRIFIRVFRSLPRHIHTLPHERGRKKHPWTDRISELSTKVCWLYRFSRQGQQFSFCWSKWKISRARVVDFSVQKNNRHVFDQKTFLWRYMLASRRKMQTFLVVNCFFNIKNKTNQEKIPIFASKKFLNKKILQFCTNNWKFSFFNRKKLSKKLSKNCTGIDVRDDQFSMSSSVREIVHVVLRRNRRRSALDRVAFTVT